MARNGLEDPDERAKYGDGSVRKRRAVSRPNHPSRPPNATAEEQYSAMRRKRRGTCPRGGRKGRFATCPLTVGENSQHGAFLFSACSQPLPKKPPNSAISPNWHGSCTEVRIGGYPAGKHQGNGNDDLLELLAAASRRFRRARHLGAAVRQHARRPGRGSAVGRRHPRVIPAPPPRKSLPLAAALGHV